MTERTPACSGSAPQRRNPPGTTPVTIPPPASTIAGLPDATLAAIAARGDRSDLPRQHRADPRGEVGDSLFILLSGRVEVYASNEDGREVVFDFHGAGEYVGEMSLDGAPRSASVITVLPTTCAIVGRTQFRDFALAHPEFAMHLVPRVDPPRPRRH